MHNFFRKNILFFSLFSILLGLPFIYLHKDVFKFNKEESKVINFYRGFRDRKKICYLKPKVISTSWHCVDKQVVEANDFLYDYNDIDTFGLPGGYINYFGDGKIIGTNGKGEMFIYNIKENNLIKQNSNLNDIFNNQKFKEFLPSKFFGRFGIKDIFLDIENNKIYASLTADVTNKGCYGIAVYQSNFNFDEKLKILRDLYFTEFFKTNTCNENFNGHAAGGRIQKLNDKIILTVGSLDFEADYMKKSEYLIPQSLNNAIGKIIEIDSAGKYKILSLGHRNQQGLMVYKNKLISTEHGPRGGDEINVIEKNEHYGWPYYSYGGDYDHNLKYRFPHKEPYKKPIFYFSPSIGISEIIFYKGMEFPYWNNKLIVTSLKEKSLFLMDFDFSENRVLSSEKIYIGHRIRDIELGTNGKIILITDDQKLIQLSRHKKDFYFISKKDKKYPLP